MVRSGPSVRVLGNLVAVGSDGSVCRLTSGARTLLAAFVAAGPNGASVDALAETRWGDELPRQWQSSFRMAVSRLRTTLGVDLASDGAGNYRLDLPVDAVDSWWLGDLAADEQRSISEAELCRALAGTAFGDVDAGYLVTSAAAKCARAQSTVAMRFCAEAGEIDAGTVALLIEHQRSAAPYHEDLILAIASCLHRARKPASAASYLDETLVIHEAELGTCAPDLLAYRASLDVSVTDSSAPPPQVPALLEHLVDEPCVGRDDELVLLRSGRSFMVAGPLGSGKTRLLAAVARDAVAAGDHVSYITSESSRTLYGPFLAAFPGLRSEQFIGVDRAASSADGGGDAAAARTAEATRTLLVVEHLDGLDGSGRQWLLIDDVHGFDEASRRLVGFLAAAKTQRPITIVVAGRNDDGQEWLPAFTSGLARSGFGSIALSPLGPADLETLLGNSLPELTVAARRELARTLFTRSSGLPALARVLIGTIDPATLAFAEIESEGLDVGREAIAALEPVTVRVGVAAAVLGDAFGIDDVVALVEATASDVDAALRELWDREIVIDGKDSGELRFANTWLRKAFLRQAPPFHLAALHAKAAARCDDVHAKADHEAAAVPKVPAAQAAESLLASARKSMADGSWLDAVDGLRRAISMLDGEPEIETLILQARALDLSGANGTGPRKVAFRRAVADERWDLALEAARSGLPEAERPDGDPDRIAMLETVPEDRLNADQRFDRALLLARQSALNGSPEDARRWIGEGQKLATDLQQRVRTEIATWSVRHHVDPARAEFTDDVVAAATGKDRMRLLHRQAITALELDDLPRAVHLHEAFLSAATEVGDPAGIWQANVFAAALEFEAGHFSDAVARARSAEDYGRRHGMQQATLVHLGQGYYHKHLRGEQWQLIERFDTMPANTEASAIAVAARAFALAAGGDTVEAWRQAEPTVLGALDRPRSAAPVVLAMVAGLVGEAADPETVERVRNRLTDFACRSLVVGFGIATTGPVHAQLALLADSPDETVDHLREAVAVADRRRAPTWQVVTRLALGRATGARRPVDEAVELAGGGELSSLIAGRDQ